MYKYDKKLYIILYYYRLYLYIYYNYYNVIIKQIIATFKLGYYYVSMLEQNPLTHLHRAIVVLRNGLRFEVTLEFPIKIILQELLQGLSITTADTKEIDFLLA